MPGIRSQAILHSVRHSQLDCGTCAATLASTIPWSRRKAKGEETPDFLTCGCRYPMYPDTLHLLGCSPAIGMMDPCEMHQDATATRSLGIRHTLGCRQGNRQGAPGNSRGLQGTPNFNEKILTQQTGRTSWIVHNCFCPQQNFPNTKKNLDKSMEIVEMNGPPLSVVKRAKPAPPASAQLHATSS